MTEKDYGLVPERISWEQRIDGERSMQVAGCHVVRAADVPPGGPQVLARTETSGSKKPILPVGTLSTFWARSNMC